jgi:glycosyltransferase involved in cell wall biosynthesis
MDKTVSIIVPVFKAEKVVYRCIESVLNQSYSDWKLLLVDDGSPDKSGNICDNYAKRDIRINVIHISNNGVSNARNTGIELVRTPWIMFLDADDTLQPNALELMMKEVNTHDFVFTRFQEFDLDGKFIKNKILISKNQSVDLLTLFINSCFCRAPWGKLFKTSIIQQNIIRFNGNIKYGEDSDFVFRYIRHISSIGFIDYPLYNYYIAPFTQNKYNNSLDDVLYAHHILSEDLSNLQCDKHINCSKQRDSINQHFSWTYLCILYLAGTYTPSDRRIELQRLKKEVYPYRQLGLSNSVYKVLKYLRYLNSKYIEDFYLSFYFKLKNKVK